ncbi:hypothetical protein [Promicromonospora sp. NPDC057488]|uniref:hypothetical protein n=1 Tax=Promicromonospora sp. NPDC057488 TaxID=3346147 RepID=UPI003672D9C9
MTALLVRHPGWPWSALVGAAELVHGVHQHPLEDALDRRLGHRLVVDHAVPQGVGADGLVEELGLGAERAVRADLIVGERNRARAPYGTSFDDVARRVAGATVHELSGQGHLAHLEDPERLAVLLDELGGSAA